MLNQDVPNALSHFEDWLTIRAQGDSRRDKLSPRSAVPYRYVWNAWVNWLTTAGLKQDGSPRAPHAAAWTLASAAHVLQYIDSGIQTAASARRGKTAPVSEITRRRYWRVLEQIYQHAVQRGLIARNPVATSSDAQAPPQEHSEGLVLLGRQWQAVALAIPTGDTRWAVRDRAIMSVLMDAGLSTAEVAGLRIDQVYPQLNQVAIKITKTTENRSPSQERILTLGIGAGVEMRRWLEMRKGMKEAPNTPPGLVFLTNRGSAMSRMTLFGIVSATVSRGLRDGGFALPLHIGPHVLRNSRIVMWINEGLPIDEACRRAGVKDFRSLRGLRRHIHPSALPPPLARPPAKPHEGGT